MNSNYSEDEKLLIENFRDHVHHILILHHEYCALQEYFDNNPQMYNESGNFFDNMARSMRFHLLLDFAKVIDRAQSFGHDNLSVDYIIENVNWPDEIRSKLVELNKKMKSFRKQIIDARNKVLSHNDVQTFLNNKVHGQFPKQDGEDFLQNLKTFTEIANTTCFDSPFNPILTFPGDVHEFCKILEKADMFNLLRRNDHAKSNEIISSYYTSKQKQ